MEKRTEKEWLILAEEYKVSDLTQKEWCKEKGINYNTFCDRLSRLRKLGLLGNEKSRSTSEVNNTVTNQQKKESIVKWVSVEDTKAHPISEIKIRIGKFEITANETFDNELFSRVCKVLTGL